MSQINSINDSLLSVAKVLDTDKWSPSMLKQIWLIKINIWLIIDLTKYQLPNDLSWFLAGSQEEINIKLLQLFYKNKVLFLNNKIYTEAIKQQVKRLIELKEEKLIFYNALIIKYFDDTFKVVQNSNSSKIY